MASSRQDAHESEHSADAHAADAHAPFDPAPVRTLSPGETPSPLWLPLVGIAIFLLGGIYLLTGQAEPGDASGSAPDESPPAAAAPAEAAPVEAAPAEARPPVRRPRPAASPADAAGVAPRKLSEEEMVQLKERVERARKAREAAQAPR